MCIKYWNYHYNSSENDTIPIQPAKVYPLDFEEI